MIKTDVIIIGGGATGCGIARDLALRGIPHCLVEKGDFAAGATGACHGLLHSGGRYVVTDPQAARECYEENLMLGKIGKKCVEHTGGLFVRMPGDSKLFREVFLRGCEKVGIPAEKTGNLVEAVATYSEGRPNSINARAFILGTGSLSDYIDAGYDIVYTCTSCGLCLLHDYPGIMEIPQGKKLPRAAMIFTSILSNSLMKDTPNLNLEKYSVK